MSTNIYHRPFRPRRMQSLWRVWSVPCRKALCTTHTYLDDQDNPEDCCLLGSKAVQTVRQRNLRPSTSGKKNLNCLDVNLIWALWRCFSVRFVDWHLCGSTRCCSWLRHCATSRKVAGPIPDGVTVIFHWLNPSGLTMALGSVQPLTETSTSNISWGKGGWCVGLTILPPSCADSPDIWEPQPPETLRTCPGL